MTIGSNTSGHFFDTTLNADGVLYATSAGVIASTAVGTSGQVLTSNGAGVAPTFQVVSSGSNTFQSIKIQTFTSSGTYTPTSGMQYCIIECVGGGGGGGGAVAGATFANSGGSGGGGGYARLFSNTATIGVSQTVTIGAAGSGGLAGNNPGGNGGDTSVGVLCIGKGGTGGGGNAGGAFATAGAGGVAGTGTFTFPGGPGMFGAPYNRGFVFGFTSPGGSSYFGQGGASIVATGTGVTGPSATNYGGGGASGCTENSGADQAGGSGSAGLVVITEFIH